LLQSTLSKLRINIFAPDKIYVNKPTEFNIELDATYADLKEENYPISIKTTVYQKLLTEIKKDYLDTNKIERRNQILSTDMNINISSGKLIRIPVKITISNHFPYVFIEFKKSKTNMIRRVELLNNIEFNVVPQNDEKTKLLNKTVYFATTFSHDEEKFNEFITCQLRRIIEIGRFQDDLNVNMEEKQIESFINIGNDALLKIAIPYHIIVEQEYIRDALLLRKIPIFNCQIHISSVNFPDKLPFLKDLWGEIGYRVVIYQKDEQRVLSSKLTLTRFQAALVFGDTMNNAMTAIGKKRCDFIVIFTPDKRSSTVHRQIIISKKDARRCAKRIDDRYILSMPPQGFLYEDNDYLACGYYVLKMTFDKDKLSGNRIELPFYVTLKS